MKKILIALLVLAGAACTSKFYVGPRTADCAIGGRSECFLIKYNLSENWMLIAEDIVGFDYEEDYIYKIKVRKVKVKDEFNNIRDGYELIEILSKEKYVPKKNQQVSDIRKSHFRANSNEEYEILLVMSQ